MLTLQILAIVVLGLMCGSELNVGAFAHPTFSRQPLETHIRVRSAFAILFGRVMPLWMSASTLLNAALLLPFAHLSGMAWRLTAISAAFQVLAIVFSLIGPVPINNRVKTWTPGSLPADWKAQEHRWGLYHWLRTCGLIVAFALLVASLGK